MGQVGQESNRRPAVVEPAALRSATFRDIREDARSGLFRWVEVRGSSPAFIGVGVNIGVKVEASGDSHGIWVEIRGAVHRNDLFAMG
jgi:hypothetical protein